MAGVDALRGAGARRDALLVRSALVVRARVRGLLLLTLVLQAVHDTLLALLALHVVAGVDALRSAGARRDALLEGLALVVHTRVRHHSLTLVREGGQNTLLALLALHTVAVVDTLRSAGARRNAPLEEGALVVEAGIRHHSLTLVRDAVHNALLALLALHAVARVDTLRSAGARRDALLVRSALVVRARVRGLLLLTLVLQAVHNTLLALLALHVVAGVDTLRGAGARRDALLEGLALVVHTRVRHHSLTLVREGGQNTLLALLALHTVAVVDTLRSAGARRNAPLEEGALVVEAGIRHHSLTLVRDAVHNALLALLALHTVAVVNTLRSAGARRNAPLEEGALVVEAGIR